MTNWCSVVAGLALAGGLGAVPAVRAAEPPRPWTLLIYGAADNNADGPMLEFLQEVRRAIDDDPGIDVLLFIDRSDGYSRDARLLGEDFTGARLYRLRRDSAERLAGGALFPEVPLTGDVELDSADPSNLRKFVAWGKAESPAARTGLLIYSHADGQTMCPDEKTDTHMAIAGLNEASGPEAHVDFLALELCNMAGVEIAYQWRPEARGFRADVLVAIPNAGPPLDWDRAFARIRTPGHAGSAPQPHLDPAAMTALDFGNLVVEEGERGRRAAAERGRPAEHEAAACFDLRAAGPLKAEIDGLARALAKSDGRKAFMEMRGPGKRGHALNYTGDGPYVDLYDLCARVADCDLVSAEVRAAAGRVMEASDRFVTASFGMDAYDGFLPGRSGFFIVLPPEGPDRWKRFTWYTPLAGSGSSFGRWSFLSDGATPGDGVVDNWFELLDSWFDSAEAGGVNGYRW